jgi:hypothetical protein
MSEFRRVAIAVPLGLGETVAIVERSMREDAWRK